MLPIAVFAATWPELAAGRGLFPDSSTAQSGRQFSGKPSSQSGNATSTSQPQMPKPSRTMQWRGPVRIVLDTNILVSALISPDGPPGRLLAAVKHDRLTLITSAPQLSELSAVLSREHLRAHIRPEEAEDLLGGLDAVGEVVTNLPPVSLSADPDDNLILATAISGRADLVVSGDKRHMLALGQLGDIPIVTASAAAALLHI